MRVTLKLMQGVAENAAAIGACAVQYSGEAPVWLAADSATLALALTLLEQADPDGEFWTDAPVDFETVCWDLGRYVGTEGALSPLKAGALVKLALAGNLDHPED